jgi:hypothetical protein
LKQTLFSQKVSAPVVNLFTAVQNSLKWENGC